MHERTNQRDEAMMYSEERRERDLQVAARPRAGLVRKVKVGERCSSSVFTCLRDDWIPVQCSTTTLQYLVVSTSVTSGGQHTVRVRCLYVEA